MSLTENTSFSFIHQALNIPTHAYATYWHSNPSSMQDVCPHEPSLMALGPTSLLWQSDRASELVIGRS